MYVTKIKRTIAKDGMMIGDNFLKKENHHGGNLSTEQKEGIEDRWHSS